MSNHDCISHLSTVMVMQITVNKKSKPSLGESQGRWFLICPCTTFVLVKQLKLEYDVLFCIFCTLTPKDPGRGGTKFLHFFDALISIL